MILHPLSTKGGAFVLKLGSVFKYDGMVKPSPSYFFMRERDLNASAGYRQDRECHFAPPGAEQEKSRKFFRNSKVYNQTKN